MTARFAARAVLFDLDGTLADTAPDLADALNQMRRQRNLEIRPYEHLRPHASSGARGMLAAGFDITPEAQDYEAMRLEFLSNYEQSICQYSNLFEGVPTLLTMLTERELPWGIVTNKAGRYTEPLVPLLGLQHAHCVVSGDTTPHSKPHPAPLLEAARRLGIAPEHCCYLGDDLRDIQAAQAAGMYSIAVAWGYGGKSEPAHWNANLLLDQPEALFNFLA